MSGAGSPACPQGVPLVGPGVPRGREGSEDASRSLFCGAKDLFGCPSAGVGPSISAAAPERNAPKALGTLVSSAFWHLVATGAGWAVAAFYLRGGRTSFTWWRRIGGPHSSLLSQLNILLGTIKPPARSAGGRVIFLVILVLSPGLTWPDLLRASRSTAAA